MPFLNKPSSFKKPSETVRPLPDSPSLGQQIGAAFQIENTVGSFLRDRGDPDLADYDPAFNVMDHLEPEELPIASEFADANRTQDIDTIRTQIDRERAARRTLGEGPAPELAVSALAVLADPTTFLPGVGAVLKGGKLATKIAAAGVGGAADAALSEGLLQSTQRERTLEESAYSVLLGGAFGMGIGGAAAAITARKAIGEGVKDATALASEFRRRRPPEELITEPGIVERTDDAAGAERVEATPDDTRIEPFVGQTVLDKMSRYNLAPVSLQMKSSDLDSVRRITDELVSTSLVTQGNVKGVATAPSVEVKIKRYDTIKAAAGRSTKDLHREHKAAGGGLGYTEFRQEIGRALRRGDQHTDASVAKAAQWMRSNVFDPLKDRAVEVGLLPEDVQVKEALSYFSRVYNREKIKARRPEFKKLASDWIEKSVRSERDELIGDQIDLVKNSDRRSALEAELDAAEVRAAELQGEITSKLRADQNTSVKALENKLLSARKEIEANKAKIDKLKEDQELPAPEAERLAELEAAIRNSSFEDYADQVIDKILGNNASRTDFLIEPLARGPLKERTFHIPDEDIEDFLESDNLEVAMRYVSTMAADVELTRAFGRADMEHQLNEIQNEANTKIEAATTEAERTRIQNEATAQTKNIQDMNRLLRNSYVSWGDHVGLKRIGRGVKQFNFMRLLGSATLSSIPDIGRVVMEEGLARSFGGLFADAATGFKATRMARKEAQLAGTGLDIVLSTRTRSLADLGDRYVSESKFERGMSRASDYFGLVNLLSYWNDGLKSWSSSLASSRILRTAEKLANGGTLTRSEQLKLAQSGIEEGLARAIAKESQHWERHAGGAILGNTEAWSDQVAIDAFRDALIQDVDRTIITPGVADRPVWMHTSTGSLITQFKSFAMASTTRLLASGLQTRDIATLNGLLVMVAFGAMATVIRDIAKDGQPKDRDARDLIVNGIDRSGALSLFVELDAVADKLTGGHGAMSTLAGKEPQRFQSRGFAGQLAGPSFGMLDDAQKMTTAFFDGEATQKDLDRGVSMIPGQNVFYIRWMLEQLKESTGLPEN